MCGVESSQDCNFSCPNGGTWFACTGGSNFIGCCASDPCHNTTSQVCPDIYAASFNGSLYNSILPNDCIGETDENWYTCTGTTPPFLGCCLINPCQINGCPSHQLIPAAWNPSHPGQLQVFLDGAPTPTSTMATSAPSSSSIEPSSNSGTGTSTSASIGTGTTLPVKSLETSGLSTGAIVGIAIGAVFAILVIIVLIAVLMYQRGWHARRKKEERNLNTEEPGNGHESIVAPKVQAMESQPNSYWESRPTRSSPHSAHGSPLPPYASPLPQHDNRQALEFYSKSGQQYTSPYGLRIEYACDTSTDIYELDAVSQQRLPELDGADESSTRPTQM